MTDPTPLKGFEPTIEYSAAGGQSTGRAGSTGVSRAKVAFVEGTRPRLADETAALLRQRLTAVALVLSLTTTVTFIRGFFLPELPLFVLRTVVLVVVIGSLVLLLSRVRLSTEMLRMVELAVFGAVAVQVLSGLSQWMLALAQEGDAASTVAGKQMIFFAWTTLILLYGMFMPNTWKRAAVVLFPAACIPYATILFLRWQSEDVAAILDADRFGLPAPMPLLAAFAGVYASHVIHSIRLEAFRARQFGQYRLKEKLGAGGMGEVYKAEHVLLKRPCAIKLIRPGNDTDATVLARFEREVRATAKLTHWNTVEIYDYGHTRDGTFYYVMELLPGLSLEELVGRHGPLPPERAVHLLRQACRALGEAHAAGLIHRDIKPANIFAAKRGGVYDVAKLLDFGLVRQQADEESADAHLTQAGSFGGSPYYVSPEQATAFSQADARTDIYSLGAVAYYLLTGRPPFSGRSAIEIIIAHSRDEVVPPGQVQDGIPADLEQVVLRCLAKDRDERFPDVGALEEALGECECADQWDDRRATAWWQGIKSA
jgi:serine/threonine-protein kinase